MGSIFCPFFFAPDIFLWNFPGAPKCFSSRPALYTCFLLYHRKPETLHLSVILRYFQIIPLPTDIIRIGKFHLFREIPHNPHISQSAMHRKVFLYIALRFLLSVFENIPASFARLHFVCIFTFIRHAAHMPPSFRQNLPQIRRTSWKAFFKHALECSYLPGGLILTTYLTSPIFFLYSR